MNTEWQIGDRIEDRWQVYDILGGPGRSGMGIVYIVYDHELHEGFAAKTFQDEVFLQNPGTADRFELESLSWIGLDAHENVTEARMVDRIRGKPYLFLEYVDGGDLSAWVRTPRLTEDLLQVLRFALQFCDGMTHVTSKGVKAHRDVKPQNCLLTANGTLKITDFGLAKVFADIVRPPAENNIASRYEALGQNLTRANAGMGTPHYMAPEQFDDASSVNIRADIYSFGVMLFEMVTGRLPYTGKSAAEFEYLHKEAAIPQLCSQSSDLNLIVERCLAKRPTARFGEFRTLRDVLADVYKKITGEAAPQPVEGTALNAARWHNKGVSLNSLGRSEEAIVCHDRALELDPLYENALVSKGNALFKLGQLGEAIACYDKALELSPIDIDAWSNKGVVLNDLQRHDEALQCYERALLINPRNKEAYYNKAHTLGDLNRTDEELACYDKALELDPQYAEAWYNKANSLLELKRFEEALACYERVNEFYPRLVEAWSNKGTVLDLLGRSEEALICFDRALKSNPNEEKIWTNKGNALGRLGRFQEALACYDHVHQLNPNSASAINNRGTVLAELGQTKEALACFEKALQLSPYLKEAWRGKGLVLALLGRMTEALECINWLIDQDPQNAQAWIDKTDVLGLSGRLDEALVCLDRAIEINPHDAEAWMSKGNLLGNSGLLREALRCFEEAYRLGHQEAETSIARCRSLASKPLL